MAKKTREVRIQEIKDTFQENEKAQHLLDSNMLDVEVLAAHILSMEDEVMKFKLAVSPHATKNLPDIDNYEPRGSIPQQVMMVQILLATVPMLDEFHSFMERFIPTMAIMAAVLDKQAELQDLHEAIHAEPS